MINKYIAHLQKRASLHGTAIAAGKDLASTFKTKVKKRRGTAIDARPGARAGGFNG